MDKEVKRLKVIRVCDKCENPIKITAREAGQFVASFRTKPNDPVKMSAAGKKGSFIRWGKKK
jgi:hypothetical protein